MGGLLGGGLGLDSLLLPICWWFGWVLLVARWVGFPGALFLWTGIIWIISVGGVFWRFWVGLGFWVWSLWRFWGCFLGFYFVDGYCVGSFEAFPGCFDSVRGWYNILPGGWFG